MGTGYSLVLARPDGVNSLWLQTQVDALLEDINDQMSTWQIDSELSRFNQAQHLDWVPVSAELAALVAESKQVSRATEGAFDVTVGPLVNLWGFGPTRIDSVPPVAVIDVARQTVGHERLAVRQGAQPALRKSVLGMYIDLSAIAKGYGVDQIAALLDEQGVEDYLVEIGGEIASRGRSPRGDAWKIGIEQPDANLRAIHRTVVFGDAHMATSGDYRNYFERDGKRYSHTIDPNTGFPVEHQLASVTVFHQSTALADAWATALMVLGDEVGLKLAEQQGLAAYFLTRQDGAFVGLETEAFASFWSESDG